MPGLTEVLRARLRKLGMPFDGEQLARAEALVRNASARPHTLDDVSLMTVAVEAYRQHDRPIAEVV
jgi:hypothetical protein